MFNMPPKEGKSQRISVWFPLWMLQRNPNLRIAIVSNEFGLARTFGEAIRDHLVATRRSGSPCRSRPQPSTSSGSSATAAA